MHAGMARLGWHLKLDIRLALCMRRKQNTEFIIAWGGLHHLLYCSLVLRTQSLHQLPKLKGQNRAIFPSLDLDCGPCSR